MVERSTFSPTNPMLVTREIYLGKYKFNLFLFFHSSILSPGFTMNNYNRIISCRRYKYNKNGLWSCTSSNTLHRCHIGWNLKSGCLKILIKLICMQEWVCDIKVPPTKFMNLPLTSGLERKVLGWWKLVMFEFKMLESIMIKTWMSLGLGGPDIGI